jgi:hypothetical protein
MEIELILNDLSLNDMQLNVFIESRDFHVLKKFLFLIITLSAAKVKENTNWFVFEGSLHSSV